MVRGNAKAVWGNPTPETMPQMPKIPALGITKADLAYLRQLLSRGAVRVNFSARVDCGWKKLLLPVGRIRRLGRRGGSIPHPGGALRRLGKRGHRQCQRKRAGAGGGPGPAETPR